MIFRQLPSLSTSQECKPLAGQTREEIVQTETKATVPVTVMELRYRKPRCDGRGSVSLQTSLRCWLACAQDEVIEAKTKKPGRAKKTQKFTSLLGKLCFLAAPFCAQQTSCSSFSGVVAEAVKSSHSAVTPAVKVGAAPACSPASTYPLICCTHRCVLAGLDRSLSGGQVGCNSRSADFTGAGQSPSAAPAARLPEFTHCRGAGLLASSNQQRVLTERQHW